MSDVLTQQAAAPSPGLHGQALLQELRAGGVRLPRKTLFALVMGGLRVRMTRSVVTMLSVVLAIAFLTYTGLMNQVNERLVAAAERYGESKPPPAPQMEEAAASLAGAELFASMPEDRRRSLAERLGMDESDDAEAELLSIGPKVRTAEAELKDAERAVRELEANPEALPVELEDARNKVVEAREAYQAQVARSNELEAQVALARYVDTGRAAGAADLPQRLEAALRERYRTVIGLLPAAGRLSEQELDQADAFLELAENSAVATDVAVLRDALRAERDKRADAELRLRLRRAGVNMQVVAQGDPLARWLILMAFLTCAVGIANAMLMSVTERFREIGTMKCLGAIDTLVVKLFLLESAFLGVIGAALGIVLGVLVALLAAVLQFGRYGFEHFPWGLDGLIVLVGSIAGGLILAVVGAAYPAWVASRMRPVDALRVDE